MQRATNNQHIFHCSRHKNIHVCKGTSNCVFTDNGTCIFTGMVYDFAASLRPGQIYEDVPLDVSSIHIHPSKDENIVDQKEQEQERFTREILSRLDREGPLFRTINNEQSDLLVLNVIGRIWATRTYNKTKAKNTRSFSDAVWRDSVTHMLQCCNKEQCNDSLTVNSNIKAFTNMIVKEEIETSAKNQCYWMKRL